MNLNIEASQTAVDQSTPINQMRTDVQLWDPDYRSVEARFDIVITASSLSVLRFSAGSAGFPVL